MTASGSHLQKPPTLTASVHPCELVLPRLICPGPTSLCDRSYRILAANAAYRANCGRPEDLIGRKCYRVSHRYPVPCDQAGESAPLARSLISGQRGGSSICTTSVGRATRTSSCRRYATPRARSPLKSRSSTAAGGSRVCRRKGLIGRSQAFRAMPRSWSPGGAVEATVLLQAESGTGKEPPPGHPRRQPRADQPFVAVDSPASPDALQERTLRPREGAFTGANTRKIRLVGGRQRHALPRRDGRHPLTMQVVAAPAGNRHLPAGRQHRTHPRRHPADLRHSPPAENPRRENGQFRQDLFYRVNAFPIGLPPCATAATISRCSPRCSWAAWRRSALRIAPEALASLIATTTRAMCASCATSSNGPASCARRRHHHAEPPA